MNEKMSKRRIQIRDLQKQEIEEKQERRSDFIRDITIKIWNLPAHMKESIFEEL